MSVIKDWSCVFERPGPMNAKFKVPAKGLAREFPTPPDEAQEFAPPRYQTGDGENEVVDKAEVVVVLVLFIT